MLSISQGAMRFHRGSYRVLLGFQTGSDANPKTLKPATANLNSFTLNPQTLNTKP